MVSRERLRLGFGCAHGVYAGAIMTQLASLELTGFSYCLAEEGRAARGFSVSLAPPVPTSSAQGSRPPRSCRRITIPTITLVSSVLALARVGFTPFARRDGEEGRCVIDLDAVWSDLQRHRPAE
jgi:hypothetical protein